MDQQRDWKAFAQRRFATPDVGVGLVELAERYATDAADVVRTLLDAIGPRRSKADRICELGFGPGWLLDEMAREFPESRLYGLDISKGMSQRAQRLYGDRVAVVLGDMERLPFREESLDVVVACWTLYFMRDIDEALEGIKRCLRPGGRLVVGASAPDHMSEYEEVGTAALRSALGRAPEPDVGARFDLDSGEPYMRRHFQHVDVRHWRGWLILREVGPLLQLWDAWRAESLVGPDGDLVRAEFERLGREWLQRDGEIRISRHGGALVGTKGV